MRTHGLLADASEHRCGFLFPFVVIFMLTSSDYVEATGQQTADPTASYGRTQKYSMTLAQRIATLVMGGMHEKQG